MEEGAANGSFGAEIAFADWEVTVADQVPTASLNRGVEAQLGEVVSKISLLIAVEVVPSTHDDVCTGSLNGEHALDADVGEEPAVVFDGMM